MKWPGILKLLEVSSIIMGKYESLPGLLAASPAQVCEKQEKKTDKVNKQMN